MKYSIALYFTLCFGQPAWNDTLNLKQIEHRLQQEKVKRVLDLPSFLKKEGKITKAHAQPAVVELESGLIGIFKKSESRFAEVAAYKASNALGLRLVPPTIMRTIDVAEGSLQFDVASSIDLLDSKKPFNKLDPKDLSNMCLFYFVFGQWDVHPGNQIIALHGGKAFLALIDNEGMNRRVYQRYGDYPFIEKGDNKKLPSLQTTKFPSNQASTIKVYSQQELYKLFSPYINDKQIEVLWQRKKSVTYVIWKDTLWFYMYKPPLRTKTHKYYASTLAGLESLNRETLQIIWSEGLQDDPQYYEQLITLTLERRNQVIRAANKGTIV